MHADFDNAKEWACKATSQPHRAEGRMTYDSTEDTLRHIQRVQDLLNAFATALIRRGEMHDQSKLGPVEKPARDNYPPDFEHRYGTPRDCPVALRSAFERHHATNSHHPEFYGEAGVSGMDLLDLVEMFFDWKAAGEPYRYDTFSASLEINRNRFALDPQLVAIFKNTAERLGWV